MPVYILEEELPLEEFIEWAEYFKRKNDREKKALEKAKTDAKLKRR